MASRSKILEHTHENVQGVRKVINLETQDRIDEAIHIIHQWVQKQDHFVKKDFPKEYLETGLVTSKGSIEKAKRQLDKLCTFKTLLPKFFTFTNITDDVKVVLEKIYLALSPHLTKEFYRIAILKLKPGVTLESSDYMVFYKFVIVICEYLRMHDYPTGFLIAVDCSEANAGDNLSKINLIELQQILPVVTEGYGGRIKGIIFITESKFIEGFIRLVKPFFSEKVSQRIHACKTVEGLREFMPVELLPSEYGGTGKSLITLHDELVEEIISEKHLNFTLEMVKAGTDESRRQRDKFNEQYMGMPGTFRTLRLD